MDYQQLILVFLGSGAFTAIISSVCQYFINKHNNKGNLEKGVMAMLGYQVKHEAERLIDQGHMSLNEYRQLEELNEIYHSLGGNGYVKTLMERVDNLPVD